MKKIAIGADEKLTVVASILDWLTEHQYEIVWHGPKASQVLPWAQVALDVARQVAAKEVDSGILLCWTGTGMSIAANKVPGIRAALCDDAGTARGAKLWNNANILCLSMRRISEVMAREILDMWFATEYQSNPEVEACLQLIAQLESNRNA